MASADVAIPSTPTKFEVLDTAQQLAAPPKETKSITPTFVPEIFRPMPAQGGPADNYRAVSSVELPLIDLKGLTNGELSAEARKELARRITNAASEWGFFHIVNHGVVSEETLADVEREAWAFFDLPVDKKMLAVDTDLYHGYGKSEYVQYLAHVHTPKTGFEAVMKQVCPGGNPIFVKSMDDFCTGMNHVGVQLLELLGEGLGLQPDAFAQHFLDGTAFRSTWRLLKYSRCSSPETHIGARPHSDAGMITLLKQEVGGLQVRKGDRFFDINPLPGAFVVNIGDTFSSWTNDIFHSVEHRVILNDKCDRLSMVYQMFPREDLLIECPSELIDDEHPSLYRPYTIAELKANFKKMVANKEVRYQRGTAVTFALRKQE